MMAAEENKFSVNEYGYYGSFGGAFIPEMLYPNVRQLQNEYLQIMYDEAFQNEFQQLLTDYVGRPTPLYLADRLSNKHGVPIYLKREDLCHTGAHKINNTIGQILLAERLGKKRIIAETGAGQHGVATATVCALKGLECIVYMGEKDIERQAPNVARMKMLGATVVPALSGSKTLKDATNEAIRDWINNPVDTHYIIGSVVGPHPYPDMVARFQSVISKEIKQQLLQKTGNELPTHVLACVGGGSNAAGAFYHFLDDLSVKLVAVEAAGCGSPADECATTQLGKPGSCMEAKPFNANGRRPGEPHSISAGLDFGIGRYMRIYTPVAVFMSATDEEAGRQHLKSQKWKVLFPLETAHAFSVLNEMQFENTDVVVVCLSGRGDKDLATYMKYIK
ncbi:MAG: tryptophan synthase subunit beta [Ferruginibacter sp.]